MFNAKVSILSWILGFFSSLNVDDEWKTNFLSPTPKCLNFKDDSEGVLVGQMEVLRGGGAISNSGIYTSLALQSGKIHGHRTRFFDRQILSKMLFYRQWWPLMNYRPHAPPGSRRNSGKQPSRRLFAWQSSRSLQLDTDTIFVSLPTFQLRYPKYYGHF